MFVRTGWCEAIMKEKQMVNTKKAAENQRLLVEMAGLEPASKHVLRKLSTRLVFH